MTEAEDVLDNVMPYSAVVGQKDVKLALEVSWLIPGLTGILLSGERGTGKSTVVRAFARMMYGHLPVTIPINATEDRVIGGWRIDALMRGENEMQPGLIAQANGSILYIDEVNLLADHIVNLILDPTSTGVLDVQREGLEDTSHVEFILVGTMNPEEGLLRPQLLDRFDLMVHVMTERHCRFEVLMNALEFDKARRQRRRGEPAPFLSKMATEDASTCAALQEAKLRKPILPGDVLKHCVALASELEVEGHRGERILALAAQAVAAIEGAAQVDANHLRRVVHMALQHRRKSSADMSEGLWGEAEEKTVAKVLG